MKWFIIIMLLPLFLSCGKKSNDKDYNKDFVRSMAIENMVDDFYPLNWLIRYYSRSYYAMPRDFEELLSFIEDCKENDLFFSEVEKECGYDIIETIIHSKILFASFNDSAFFYLPDYKMGSCVIGTPRLWVESPNSYPELASRYETIPPSAFYTSGKFVFNLDYASIESFIYHLSENQGNKIFYMNQMTGEMVPLKAIFVYDNLHDSLSISSIIPSNEFLYYSSGNDEYSSVSSNYTTNHYLQRILPEIIAFFTDKQEVAKVYFVTGVFEQ